MSSDLICVSGAREHNLKNIDVCIPKHRLVVITGISGSGKSSLAFDTIYAEGQRRYLETFGAYSRQFIGNMERPDVDQITGLSPVISIEQKTTNKNPRSTVGTVTEIYDFLRLLFARIGVAYSYVTGKPMVKWTEKEILENIYKKYKNRYVTLLAPLVRGRKGHYRELFEEIRKKGFVKVRVDGVVQELRAGMQVDRYVIHDIEAVVDRLEVNEANKARLSRSVQQTLKMGKELMFLLVDDKEFVQYSKKLICEDTGMSYEEPSPNTFSFNSPYGACPDCKGLGNVYAICLDRVMPDKSLSVKEGGIAPLGEERSASVFQQVVAFSAKHKIPLNKPLNSLSKAQLNLLLYGDKGINPSLTIHPDDDTVPHEYTGSYEGIIPMLKRWFISPYSTDMLREWVEQFLDLNVCDACGGARLKKESLHFKILGKNIAELSDFSLDELALWIDKCEPKLDQKQRIIARDVIKEIRDRLQFLLNVGLHYLSLSRPTRTLSGGESQRIRLATQIGSQLQGITYILDEPSIGLHQRDNQKLIEALQQLRDMGNSVLVVEHDKEMMLSADHLIDIGPYAGHQGGRIVASGSPQEVMESHTLTAAYLKGHLKIPVPAERRKGNGRYLILKGATGNNLKNVTVQFPLGMLICVTGVSGSGKSTLINETLYPILARHIYGSRLTPLPYKSAEGLEQIDKVIEIDQSPIGRTPRSNPATYCGFFTDIRTLFASLPESKVRGYTPGRFSFNVKSGRCEVCEGGGMKVIEMNFLPDVYVRCEKCHGKRYNRETLEIRYKGKSIADVLEMTVEEAAEFFKSVPYLYRKIKVLEDVGLGYITLGQSAVTLSGGEAQRIKLATELSKRDTGKTFYILDEPTTGLHFEDIRHLLDVLNKLVDRGNTVLVIEHNPDVIKAADYIIDLGPEGGEAGGGVVFCGTPGGLIKWKKRYTGRFLINEIKNPPGRRTLKNDNTFRQ
ncbi:MAG: excinuclease ABC subunit UvrA [Chitinophagaceae bacterium]|nr:excinuclease ABC subunit UvrA [Chitinophagaceae bacterium]